MRTNRAGNNLMLTIRGTRVENSNGKAFRFGIYGIWGRHAAAAGFALVYRELAMVRAGGRGRFRPGRSGLRFDEDLAVI
jgi:hypothetical protein